MEHERVAIINAFKDQWEEINREYSKLSLSLHNLHTIERVRKKEKCEQQMSRLERMIERLSHPFVFVREKTPSRMPTPSGAL